MTTIEKGFLKRDYWINNTDFYKVPYFRLEKCAKNINALTPTGEYDLLDIGCGPATLSKLIGKNVHYYGIDIAIHVPADNLIEIDVSKHEINFKGMQFDIIVATGLFEYLGEFQRQKLSEIQKLLKANGRFITTYTNFNHIHPPLQEPTYNNVITIKEFRNDLDLFFSVEKSFPSSHNWIRREPQRNWVKKLNMLINFKIPYLSRRLANNYFFICTPK
jgi:SAM-dependent methyltransferase